MFVPSSWRTRHQRYSLIGEVCPACDKHIFPPRDVCPHCDQPAGPAHKFNGTGMVFRVKLLTWWRWSSSTRDPCSRRS